ncbi:PREDICTED: putative histone-lysine N-methyltransferase 1 [Eufriesea mexicana]|uniref:putative histone-lysine N-methyltransferase 1 n=1 Tax=Eufriesea mexicana TaxID=516756 RepID=UPI00083BED2E|nr:PREDICTED: putative histone-lysine N-methyltransferase 1 [Eufriesea mexicana]
MEDMFNLSKLIKFLHQILVFTEEVKNILKSNCDEAVYCLKPWYLEINSLNSSKDACPNSKAEVEVQEIAAGISRVLTQTQQLREKLSFNTTEKNRKKSKTFQYECFRETENRKQKKVQNLSVNDKNVSNYISNNSKQNMNAAESNMQTINIDKGLQNKIAQRDAYMTHKKTKSESKQLTHTVKSLENKNFLVINKRNIKNIREIKQCKDINKLKNNVRSNSVITQSRCTMVCKKQSVTSTNELKNLIQKVSAKSNNYTLSNEYSVKYPLHEETISQSMYEQNLIVMNMINSFDATNIPEEIIKSLKIYYTYLNIEFTQKSCNEKLQKVLHVFLVQFNNMNGIIHKNLIYKDNIITVLLKFISLFQSLFSQNIEMFNLRSIKTIYTELSSAWKMYEVKEVNIKQVLKNNVYNTLHVTSNTTECMSNGIWNYFYNRNFEGVLKTSCIRYTTKDQLFLFFNIIQHLQYIQYHDDLIEIITEDVLPNMNIFSDSTQLEYIKIYKMISILYQGLNPKIPVLVRIDK